MQEMSKDAYYFKHDSNARNDEKLLEVRRRFGMEGYGIYWAIVEKLREATGYMLTPDYNAIAWDLRCKEATVKAIVEDFGLFYVDEGLIASRRLLEDMAKWERKRQAHVEGGRRGMASRWKKYEDGENDEGPETATTEPPVHEPLTLSGEQEKTPPAPRKPRTKKYSDEQTSIHSQCKTIFSDIYRQYKGVEFIWSAKEMAGLVNIVKNIQFQIGTQSLDMSADAVVASFNAFVSLIFQRADDWTKRNATPVVIASKFNEIYTQIKNNTHNGNTHTAADSGNARDDAGYVSSIFADVQSGANR